MSVIGKLMQDLRGPNAVDYLADHLLDSIAGSSAKFYIKSAEVNLEPGYTIMQISIEVIEACKTH